MSVLGIDKIMRQIEDWNLVEYPKKLGLEAEGIEIELRVGNIYESLKSKKSLLIGIEDRRTLETELVASYNFKKNHKDKNQKSIEINPGKYYLVETIEKLDTPRNLFPVIVPRTTLFRSGLCLQCSTTSPGYKGTLTFGLYNAGPMPVYLVMGAKIAKVRFEEINGTSTSYDGQWQYGRVTTSRKGERQTNNRIK